ncbi:MAG: right-handed parallel beta-helix repeat-containing protein [Bacteroidota bacterium]|nr:right-handed parallel beta-helix repeat-containing protein [Bacteroidota bacterium]
MEKRVFLRQAKSRLIVTTAMMLLAMGWTAFSQLSGVKTIPGNYATIQAAIADLNLYGVGSGGVTFNVAAGHAETFTSPTAGHITTTTSSPGAPIVFQKSGTGANPLITSGTGTGTTDGIIVITGTSYITFDGIDVRDNPSNTNTTTQMEWGYALVKKSAGTMYNGCQYAVIRNCSITLNTSNTSTVGIKLGNHLATSTTSLTLTSPAEAHNNCRIYNDTIVSAYNGIRAEGYSASAPYTLYDQNNNIGGDGGNVIMGFGGASSTAYAVYTSYQNNLTVANNIITGGTGTTGTLYGICLSTATNASASVRGNIVNVTGSSTVYAIYTSAGSSGTGNTIRICANMVRDCSAAGTLGAVYNAGTPAWLVIDSNTVRKCVTTSTLYGVYLSSTATAVSRITDNLLDSLISTGASTAYGIYHNGASTTYAVTSGNTIRTLRSTGGSGTVYGLYVTTSLAHEVYKNRISDILSRTGTVRGIYIGAANVTTIVNNIVSEIYSPEGTAGGTSASVGGIWNNAGSGMVRLYYNTVYLDASSTGINFGSTAVYANTGSTTEMRNNILVNLSSPGMGSASASTVVYTRSSTSIGTYAVTSDNNCYFAGTPSAYRLIYYDGTNSDQTLAQFRLRVGHPRDIRSVTESVPFINTASPPYNLHLSSTVPTQCESGALRITSPVTVTDDCDGNPRQGEAGYTGTGLAPDIGAYEGNYTANDLTGPAILYTPLGAGIVASTRQFPGVEITDVHGVDTTSGTRPRLYYKKGALYNEWNGNTSATPGWKWVEANGPASPFDFTIDYSRLPGGAVAAGDTIFYFVVAQDRWTTPNVGITRGTFAAQPASVALTASAFPIGGSTDFFVIGGGLRGVYTIPGSYPSLTGANGFFASVNNRTLTGDVVVLVTDSVYEDGTVALGPVSVEPPGAPFGIRIQPDTNIVRTLFSRSANGMIRLDGADRVTFDGRFGGGGRYLRLVNAGTANSVISFQSDACYDTVRSCIIEGNNTTTAGNAACGVVRIGTGLVTGNDSLVIMGNIIRNRSDSAGSPTTMIYAAGTHGAFNSDILIKENDILNFTTYGICVYNVGNGNGWVISNNHFYNTTGTPLTAAVYFIYFVPQAVSSGNTISGNFIGGTARQCGGGPLQNSASANCYGIAATVGLGAPTSIQGNTIRNLSFTNTSGTGLFYGIYVNGGTADIGTVTGNVIGDPVKAASILSAQSGTLYGIYTLAPGPVNICNNIVANIKATNTGSYSMGGIHHGGGTPVIRNNRVTDLESASGATTSAPSAMFGIMSSSSAPTQLIEENIVERLTNTGGGTPGSAATSCHGIILTGAASSGFIKRNAVNGLANTSTGSASIVGMRVAAGNWTFADNMIALTNGTNTNSPTVCGILDEVGGGGFCRYFYNTVAIGGSNGTTSAHSQAYLRAVSTNVSHANNIYYNARGGGGNHVAYGSVVTGGWASDFNFLVSPDTSRLALWNNVPYGFPLFRRNSGADTYSLTAAASAVPAAAFFTGFSTGNLGIDSTNALCWYVNGKGAAGSIAGNIADDFTAANVRSTTFGFATDIGADEFSTSTAPPPAAASGAPQNNATTTYSFAGQPLASITWGSGGTVPSAIDFRYYSGSNPPGPLAGNYSNAYAAVTATGGSGYTYTMTVGYSPAWLGTISAPYNIRLAKRDGGVWAFLPGSTVDTASQTVTVAGLTSFSEFALTDVTNPLPMELVSFTAQLVGNRVRLVWKTASELNSLRFEIERRTPSGVWQVIGVVDAHGTTDRPHEYEYTDENLPEWNAYVYRLRMVDRDGTCEYSSEVCVVRSRANEFRVLGAYPNPFAETSVVSFALPAESYVTVRLVDGTGREVRTLYSGILLHGIHAMALSGRGLAEGVYTCVVTAGTSLRTVRIVRVW